MDCCFSSPAASLVRRPGGEGGELPGPRLNSITGADLRVSEKALWHWTIVLFAVAAGWLMKANWPDDELFRIGNPKFAGLALFPDAE